MRTADGKTRWYTKAKNAEISFAHHDVLLEAQAFLALSTDLLEMFNGVPVVHE